MNGSRSIAVLAALAALASAAIAPAGNARAQETNDAKIQRALSAAPAELARGAAVVDVQFKTVMRDGKEMQEPVMTTLREGTNSITCIPGQPGVVGFSPMCADPQGLQWIHDFVTGQPRPSTTQPGVVYMLAGGTDWSPSDPKATSGTPFEQPPHWMLMWAFDAKTSGFSTEIKDTGTWLMWAGTPWAHLMINQKP
jgi:hypothetical protein